MCWRGAQRARWRAIRAGRTPVSEPSPIRRRHAQLSVLLAFVGRPFSAARELRFLLGQQPKQRLPLCVVSLRGEALAKMLDVQPGYSFIHVPPCAEAAAEAFSLHRRHEARKRNVGNTTVRAP